MAIASIRDLAKGGLLYITEIDGTTFVNAEIANTPEGVDDVKRDALNRQPLGSEINPLATFEVTLTSIVGDLTSLNINGVNQISANVLMEVGQEITSAINIAAEINATIPTTGANFTASSSGNVVYITAAETVGSSLNGQLLTYTDTGTHTITTTDLENGSDGNELYSQLNGHRYFLDAGYGATGCAGSGTALPGDLTNAIEVTKYFIKRGAEGGTPFSSALTIDSNLKLADYTRLENSQIIGIKEGAPTVLEFVPTNEASLGDELIIYSQGSEITFVDITVATQGNMMLVEQTSFASDGNEESISLRYVNDPTYGFVWAEMWRSTPVIPNLSIVTALINDLAVTTGKIDNGAVTAPKIAVGTIIQSLMATDSVDAINILADAITTVKILDLNVTTAKIALLAITEGLIASNAVTSAKILDGAVSVAKLSADANTDLITVPVSWDTDRLGSHKIIIPFACTVQSVDIYSTDTVEATDDADIEALNDALLSMGTASFVGGTTIGTGQTITATLNNTFLAGEVMSLVSTKITPGGNALASITVLRT
jgi:hypothetical protein